SVRKCPLIPRGHLAMCPLPVASLITHTSSRRFRPDAYLEPGNTRQKAAADGAGGATAIGRKTASTGTTPVAPANYVPLHLAATFAGGNDRIRKIAAGERRSQRHKAVSWREPGSLTHVCTRYSARREPIV